MISAAATSLLAGSLAGAVGVGVAFPLDTLKTRAQVMETEVKLSMPQVVRAIYKQDGLKGFFGGVKGMMLGQAVIKSIAFGCNAATLAFLQQHFPNVAPAALLITAACFAGFITSFFVTPVERVKVMMQASSGTYANEIACLRAILRREGWAGLFGRGLGPTLIRETPSYGIYFFIYGYLMQTPLAPVLGGVAPLLFGAASGCACWIPVYPVRDGQCELCA
jgi:solute carrier family 25 carnitine/acylcarnitine transporter 20/29